MKIKIKSFDEMPAWAKCCSTTIKAMAPYHGEVFDVHPNLVNREKYACPFCGADYGSSVAGPAYIFSHDSNAIVFASMVDVDKSSIN